MMRIIDASRVPPGGAFVYVQPESQMQFKAHALPLLFQLVKAHRRANDYPIGLTWRLEVEAYICEHQPETCGDMTPPEPMTKVKLVAKFLSAMSDWASEGFKLATPEVFADRYEICQQCPMWGGDAAFGLGRCGKCGCSGLKLKVATQTCPIGKW